MENHASLVEVVRQLAVFVQRAEVAAGAGGSEQPAGQAGGRSQHLWLDGWVRGDKVGFSLVCL